MSGCNQRYSAFVAAREQSELVSLLRNHYWLIRQCRPSVNAARIRMEQRKVEAVKEALFRFGVDHDSMLGLLRCCRLKCSKVKFPFTRCQWCP